MRFHAYRYDYIRKLASFHKKVKFIFIERNCKGVVNSFIKLGFFPPGKRRINTFNIKRFAKEYLHCVNYIDKYLPQESRLNITFEEFIQTPQEVLSRIFMFLGADASESTIDSILNTPSKGLRQVYSGIKKNVVNDWSFNINGAQAQWLDRLYNQKRFFNRQKQAC